MSESSLSFRLTAASFFQEKPQRSLRTVAEARQPLVHVYAPEHDVAHVSDVLKRANIPHVINQYELRDYQGKTLCFFKRSDLSSYQLEFLVNAASAGGQVEALLDYLDRHLHFVEVELLHGDYLLDSNIMRAARRHEKQWSKRVMDIGLSLLLLCLTLPVWALTALAIRLESAGPVFFRQRRTGLFNQEFEIIKFRSMRQDAEKDGAKWASKNDSRITRVGSFIRKTRIDELPQLINVLKGEMSLIGPRPEREVFIRELEQVIPFYRFRHMVKPGVTGLAQVKYSYGASVEDAMYKHRHDIYYIKHQNVWLDMHILLQTVRIVVTGQGV